MYINIIAYNFSIMRCVDGYGREVGYCTGTIELGSVIIKNSSSMNKLYKWKVTIGKTVSIQLAITRNGMFLSFLSGNQNKC